MTFRILSIDGGGIRGVIPAAILTELERVSERPIAEAFDMIIGTSTGGLLALGLSIPSDATQRPLHSAENMLAFYRDKGPEIFDRPLWKILESPRGLTEEKHSAAAIERILLELMGAHTMFSLNGDPIVAAYHIGAPGPRLLHRTTAPNMRAADAARATSAAPTFFEPADIGGTGYIDGAMFANNPALHAVALAMSRGIPCEQISVLSIGTGVKRKPIDLERSKTWGLLEWAGPVVESLMNGQELAAHGMLAQLRLHTYTRIQGELVHGSEQLDDASPENIAALENDADRLLTANAHEMAQWALAVSASEGVA